MTNAEILKVGTPALKEHLDSLENEKQAIEDSIRSLETELFYRANPECRINQ